MFALDAHCLRKAYVDVAYRRLLASWLVFVRVSLRPPSFIACCDKDVIIARIPVLPISCACHLRGDQGAAHDRPTPANRVENAGGLAPPERDVHPSSRPYLVEFKNSISSRVRTTQLCRLVMRFSSLLPHRSERIVPLLFSHPYLIRMELIVSKACGVWKRCSAADNIPQKP